MSRDKVAAFLATQNVSRETLGRLDRYVQVLMKWNQAYNLVGKTTENDVWWRHILDSAQILPYVSRETILLDVGTGAGLPGLILHILGLSKVYLVEKNAKKVQFLKMAMLETAPYGEETGLSPVIHAGLLEDLAPFEAETITARAYTDLSDFLRQLQPFTGEKTQMILLKGEKWQEEVTKARDVADFNLDAHPSLTHPQGRLLVLKDIRYSGIQ